MEERDCGACDVNDCFYCPHAKTRTVGIETVWEKPPTSGQSGSAVGSIAEDLQAIQFAVKKYYEDLDNRKHGGVAADECLRRIQNILGMEWERGATLKK